jgi:site-specific DNA recombinase
MSMKRTPRNTPSPPEAKGYIALARVSSREQAREGFSLDVQEAALNAYAQRRGGQIIQLFRVAETASKSDERKTFKQMRAYVRTHAGSVQGILVYKIDRAARNMFDYVELERLESVHDIPLIAISQPTENTPAGRMQRRMLASMASFFTEQQSLDVREGLAKRAQAGLFVGMTPYGYRNHRENGRSIVVVEPREADNVRRIFELYAHHHLTIDGVIERLHSEGITYTPANPNWTRSKVHVILRDRAYIGEIKYQGQWHPGIHEPIVQRGVWQRCRR